jgi:hypothetical protein
MNTPANPPPVDIRKRNRNRWMLVALFGLFFGAMLVAGALRFSGWRPQGMKNKGELLQPYGDLRATAPRLASGAIYAWEPKARIWRIATVARGCDGARAHDCERLLADLDKVWRLMGKEADRVDLLWIGALPAGGVRPRRLRVLEATPALRAELPHSDDPRGAVVYLVDPNGFVVLRYPPGFDAGGLRTDLARLLKLK